MHGNHESDEFLLVQRDLPSYTPAMIAWPRQIHTSTIQFPAVVSHRTSTVCSDRAGLAAKENEHAAINRMVRSRT